MTTTSNEYNMRDIEKSPVGNAAFHPTSSLDTNNNPNAISPFDNYTSTNNVTRDSQECASSHTMAKKVGLRTVAKSRHEKSPISLKKIINKLE